MTTQELYPVLDPPIARWLPNPMGETPRVVVVIGAGGTGARLLPVLIKLLKQEDLVIVVDGDIVEERNLFRQHFDAGDVGRFKAEVMQDRYHRVAQGPSVVAIPSMLNGDTRGVVVDAATRVGQSSGAIIVGCVDSGPARMECNHLYNDIRSYHNNAVYIDAGNETSTGQAVIAIACWPIQPVGGQFLGALSWEAGSYSHLYILGWPAAHDLWDVARDATDGTENCAFRIDLQTVQINQMAATACVNLLVPFLYGTPLVYPGLRFNADGLVQPIPWGRRACPSGATSEIPAALHADRIMVSIADNGISNAHCTAITRHLGRRFYS